MTSNDETVIKQIWKKIAFRFASPKMKFYYISSVHKEVLRF